MKSLIIYDNYGQIVNILYGAETVPTGIQGIVTVIPQGKMAVRVDVTTNPHTVVFEDVPNPERDLTDVQLALVELEARVAELEGK